jgi:hypothetical protein
MKLEREITTTENEIVLHNRVLDFMEAVGLNTTSPEAPFNFVRGSKMG